MNQSDEVKEKQRLQRKISDQLSSFLDKVRADTTVNQFAAAASAESFICDLLNIVCGWNLKNTEKDEKAMRAVDLVDVERKVAVEITANDSMMQIRMILERFERAGLNEKFIELYIVQLTDSFSRDAGCFAERCEKKRYSLNLLTIADLVRKIQGLDYEKIKAVSEFLDGKLGGSAQQTTDDSGTTENADDKQLGKNNPYVFISYAHKDIDTVKEIVDQLSSNGLCMWWDQNIEPGIPWDETIGNHLFGCKCLVAFVTKQFVKSSNCMDEIYIGKMKNKLLLVCLDDVELPPKMYRYMRIQALRFHTGTTKEEICERLSKTELLKGCYLQ